MEFMAEEVLLQALHGRREPGAAHRALQHRGCRGKRGSGDRAGLVSTSRGTRQQNGEVAFVLLLARPGCDKL